MRIGFFDSGIGGISVLHDALKQMPQEDYLYYADQKNVPYGAKTKKEVRRHVMDAAEFLIQKDIDALVIACNTATSVAIGDLRMKYGIPIIGMEPAVKPAIETPTGKRILVTATVLTLKEKKLKNLITALDGGDRVDFLPLPKLVAFAENNDFRDGTVRPYLEKELASCDLRKYGTVVLGCTHFIFYRKLLRKMIPRGVSIIDGNQGTVNHLKAVLEQLGAPGGGEGSIVYYASGEEVTDEMHLRQYDALLHSLDEVRQ